MTAVIKDSVTDTPAHTRSVSDKSIILIGECFENSWILIVNHDRDRNP